MRSPGHLSRFAFAIGVLFAVSGVQAQQVSDTVPITFGVDGSTWRTLDDFNRLQPLVRLALVRGIYDGLRFGRSPMMPDYYTGTSYLHLIRALDQFYADPANEQIPVVWGLHVVSLDLTGSRVDVVDSLTRVYRRRISEAVQQSPPNRN